MVKGLVIFSLVCVCWTKFAPDTAPKVAKEDTTMIKRKIKDKVNNKLNEKKQYVFIIDKEGLFSVAVVTALSMLSKENRTLECADNDYAVLILNVDMKQKAAIELALSDYLIQIDIDEEKPELKSAVYK